MADENPTLRDQLEDAVDQTIVDPTPEVQAPEAWDDKDKGVFNTIQDPAARQWLLDRDTGLNTRLTETQDKYKGIEEAFAPYEERLKTTGQTRAQVVSNLIRAQDILEKQPEEGLRQLVKMFGLTPEIVLKALNIQAPKVDGEDPNAPEDLYADLAPALAARMRERDAQLETLLNGSKQTQEAQVAQVRQDLAAKATTFRETKDDKGQPVYPYMTDQRVVDKMSQLLKSSIVKVEDGDVNAAYKNAYDQAVYSFPDIREKLTASTVDQDRVNKARRAGASPRPDAGASRATPKVGNSVREQLQAAFNSGE